MLKFVDFVNRKGQVEGNGSRNASHTSGMHMLNSSVLSIRMLEIGTDI